MVKNKEMRGTDGREKSNKCNQCDSTFSQASHLRTHLRIHSGEKSNKCNQCDSTFSQASNLRTHLKIHSGEKTNKCNQCDYACSEPSHLKTRSGENKKMQPMRLCILLCKRFEETFENTQWRKVKQMQPV